MTHLGIDFGVKKIGLALSDERGKVAFPHAVVANDKKLFSMLDAVIDKHNVGMIVVGDTRTIHGAENEITAALEIFVKTLEQKTDKKIVLVPEHGTTGAARAGIGEGAARGTVASPHRAHKEAPDARAAALILQRYLDACGGK